MAPSLPAALCRPPRSQGGHSLFSHGPVYPGGFARFLCLKYSLLQEKREESKSQKKTTSKVTG
jgi:hypothetical protein